MSYLHDLQICSIVSAKDHKSRSVTINKDPKNHRIFHNGNNNISQFKQAAKMESSRTSSACTSSQITNISSPVCVRKATARAKFTIGPAFCGSGIVFYFFNSIAPATCCGMASNENSLSDSGDHVFFEGVEKLLEVWFGSGDDGHPNKDADLRNIPRFVPMSLSMNNY